MDVFKLRRPYFGSAERAAAALVGWAKSGSLTYVNARKVAERAHNKAAPVVHGKRMRVLHGAANHAVRCVKRGRPRSLSQSDVRKLRRALGTLRKKSLSFSVRQVAREVVRACFASNGLPGATSLWLFWRSLKRKGVLTSKDRSLLLAWCKSHAETPLTH